ncbi:MAG: ribosome bioproteinis GTPase [Methanosaeta sp. ASP1-1]|nr:ribosome small subunit-dependent GTPase A [Methanothrix sp.]OYV08595.1 MAG: ribosome bioproteinis GTPase [Methanosaeta sp. ASP1-1]
MDSVLRKLGWNSFFGENFREYAMGFEPGRISRVNKNDCRVHLKSGEVKARVSGRQRHDGLYPAVGDWVALSKDISGTYTIHAILPRKSKISRKDAGKATGEQIIVTNIDVAFIMTSLNRDLNMRRLERYLSVVRQNRVDPVILLNKSDICANVEARIKDVKAIAQDVPIYAISATEGIGMQPLSLYLQEGKTVVLLGSSGVGKSTLINALEGNERQKISEIREDDCRGRHTTTARELILLEKGGVIIDNPGMREMQLWEAGVGLQNTFPDIEELAAQCKFSDCRHETEPGCMIKKAILDGELSEVRFESYNKLQREALAVERKKNPELMIAEKKKWKKLGHMAEKIRDIKEHGR